MNTLDNIKAPYISLSELPKNKQNIVLDTNFLFIPFKYKTDIIREFERILDTPYTLNVLESTITELQEVIEKKKKDKKFIPVVVKLLNLYNFNIIKTTEEYHTTYTDEIIEQLPYKNIIIATMDKELRDTIKRNKGRTIVFKQKKYLVVY